MCEHLTLYFSSILRRYAPIPGGGGRQVCHISASAAPASTGNTKQSRNPHCSMCTNSGLPVLEEICPFHQERTEGFVLLYIY